MRIFVSGSGTGVGKTHVTAALAAWARREGFDVRAWKPVETGVGERPLDAARIALAAGQGTYDLPGFLRLSEPVAPIAVGAVWECDATLLEGHMGEDLTLIEGAGGLASPITETLDNADLAKRLGADLLLVVPDRLGCLHDARVLLAYATQPVRALVLLRGPWSEGLSITTNASLLRRLVPVPVEVCGDLAIDSDALARDAPSLLGRLTER